MDYSITYNVVPYSWIEGWIKVCLEHSLSVINFYKNSIVSWKTELTGGGDIREVKQECFKVIAYSNICLSYEYHCACYYEIYIWVMSGAKKINYQDHKFVNDGN